MKVISVANNKGGIGKSITAMSLAYVAANEFNKKVLFIDMDSQSSSSIVLGVTPYLYDSRTPFQNIPELIKRLDNEDLSYEIDYLDGEDDDEIEDDKYVTGIHTIFDKMIEEKNQFCLTKELIESCIHKPYYILKEAKKKNGKYVKDKNGSVVYESVKYSYGFDVMPSTEYLSDIQIDWGSEAVCGKTIHQMRGQQLAVVIDFICKNYPECWDVCIIDTPPSLDLLSANAIYASVDGVIIPCSGDKQSLYSLARIKRTIRIVKNQRKGHLGALGIVLTIFNEKRVVDKYISKTVGKDTKLRVFNTRISETTDAKKAILSGLILPQINRKNYEENCALFKEIENAIDEGRKREEGK